MNQAIEVLMDEHRLIVRVLAALDTLADTLAGGAPAPRADVARFATFFREFADKCHHGKEEDRLFVQMNQHGFPREYGPLGVMLAEHTAGRAHVRALHEIGGRAGELTPEEIREAVAHAREFVPLLLSHIQKEDHVLYPMAEQAIPPKDLDRLVADCVDFEREVVGVTEIARLRALGEELVLSYPADPEKQAAATAHTACVGHACGMH